MEGELAFDDSMDDGDLVNEDDRPTVPQAFDIDAERFFATQPHAPVPLAEVDDEDVSLWWAAQRRKVFAAWVTAIMVVCAAVLAAGVLDT